MIGPPSPSAPLLAIPLLVLLGCATEPTGAPDSAPTPTPPEGTTGRFEWSVATPESQGMCGTTRQLGCTHTLLQVWNGINNRKYRTKRFIVIRNDKVIYDRGDSQAHSSYSASKGLLGAPTLVYAMSQCGVGLTDPVSRWLAHGDGARWANEYPWTDITVEHLATHTSGICDYGNPSSICGDENPGWQTDYDLADRGDTSAIYRYPGDAFTIARAKSEQNQEPALPPGSTFEYSNVGHALLNYAVQKACGQKLADIFDLHIKQPGMGSPIDPALIHTDDGHQLNQSTGVAKWEGLDGAAVLRLAGRLGIWNNRNAEPVRYWHALTRVADKAAAAAAGWGVVYQNNSRNVWTETAGHQRFSLEMFGHGGNYSTVFVNDPLTGTIIVRQGDNNAQGASYLTQNGCAPGWTGTAPNCSEGTNWSNNWDVASGTLGSSQVGPRKKVIEPLQEAFFFPPPFCRMTAAAGRTVDTATDIYQSPPDATTIDLAAEITVNPREGAGSSEIDKVEFYKETDGSAPEYIGDGTIVSGTSPPQYRLSYSAESHGAANEIRTYFANCIARSVQDLTKKVPSYSRPVRVKRP